MDGRKKKAILFLINGLRFSGEIRQETNYFILLFDDRTQTLKKFPLSSISTLEYKKEEKE